jgi:hypothetical protein
MTIGLRRTKADRHEQDSGLDSLVLDLVEWVGRAPRSYAQVMEAGGTSCPRLAVWEEALDRGYLMRCQDKDGATCVRVTAAGRAFLDVASALRQGERRAALPARRRRRVAEERPIRPC